MRNQINCINIIKNLKARKDFTEIVLVIANNFAKITEKSSCTIILKNIYYFNQIPSCAHEFKYMVFN